MGKLDREREEKKKNRQDEEQERERGEGRKDGTVNMEGDGLTTMRGLLFFSSSLLCVF